MISYDMANHLVLKLVSFLAQYGAVNIPLRVGDMILNKAIHLDHYAYANVQAATSN